MEERHEAELREHYERGEERDRLERRAGRLEFARTTEIVLRLLPPAPALVADIGGGPGRYALWLGGLGYRVEHRDLMPLHVRQVRDATLGASWLRSAVGDARDLDLDDASVDAVLLLGPLYHLRRRTDRLRALAEARRVVRPGGPVFAAAISRWAPRLDGELAERLYEQYPHFRELTPEVERTGLLPPLRPGSLPCVRIRKRSVRSRTPKSVASPYTIRETCVSPSSAPHLFRWASAAWLYSLMPRSSLEVGPKTGDNTCAPPTDQ